MPDIVSSEKRSLMMAGIKGKNTKPELLVRSLLHRNGFRFRLHDRKLPGKPDLVFPKFQAIILIHGCFWHGHNCSLFKLPSTNEDFWKNKITGNKERDLKDLNNLNEKGWRVLTLWECALRGKGKIELNDFFEMIKLWLLYDIKNHEIKGL